MIRVEVKARAMLYKPYNLCRLQPYGEIKSGGEYEAEMYVDDYDAYMIKIPEGYYYTYWFVKSKDCEEVK